MMHLHYAEIIERSESILPGSNRVCSDDASLAYRSGLDRLMREGQKETKGQTEN